jgi:hypothetical protein
MSGVPGYPSGSGSRADKADQFNAGFQPVRLVSHLQQGASQAAEKPTRPPDFKRFVTGHDFSHADKANQINVGL